MILLMDMGTTNTRLYLSDGQSICARQAYSFGAGHGQGAKAGARDALSSFLQEQHLLPQQIDLLLAAGMAGSEKGLVEVPHCRMPVSFQEMLPLLQVRSLPEVTSIPIVIIPGIKKTVSSPTGGEWVADMMRGEETEVCGILTQTTLPEEAVLVLPGTHNKILLLQNGAITDCITTMSGELMDCFCHHTILQSAVDFSFSLEPAALAEGARCAKENGFSHAAFLVRVQAVNGSSTVNARTSFLLGAVLEQDIALIRQRAAGRPVYIGGKEPLRTAYQSLLGSKAIALSEDVCTGAMCRGLLYFYQHTEQFQGK